MRSLRLLVAPTLAVAVALSTAVPVGAAPTPPASGSPRSTAVIDDAVAWLRTQQQPDGGFEVAGFAGFETPDAVLAIGGAAQSGPGWVEGEARDAVIAFNTVGAMPKDPLDALDDQVDTVQGDPASTAATKAQQAAKIIALVTVPLGLDASDFDPSADSAGAVDLEAALTAGAGPGADYASLPFTGRAFALWALGALGDTPPPALVADIDDAQQADGGFNFSGDAEGVGIDPDTTGVVIIALAVTGRTLADDTVADAAVGLGRSQRYTGEWASDFDTGNPNSTAVAMLAAATLGSNPDQPCWRETAEARFTGVPYPSPADVTEDRQAADGHIASPNDGFGLNTFGTSQAVQALVAVEGSWPYSPPTGCTPPSVSNNRRLVNAFYFDLLSRFTDEAGAAFFTGQLAGGMTPAQVARRITGTSEYGRKVTDRLYRAYLDRPATPEEQSFGGALVRAGRRYDAAAAILGSQEYFDAVDPGGETSNEEWADAVFLDAVGRPADDAGRSYVLDQLAAGRTRTRVARLLLGSSEGLSTLVRDTYRQLLRRDPEPAGRTFWVGQIRNGRSPESLVTLIAGSGEYVTSTRPPT